uniref:Plastocyanin-like domain-containing protein n=1 Tax=Panagrellus redivivus TaxID=6233 RepID=A0A7E4UQM8_PANRE
MYSRFVLLILCLIFGVVQGEVKLTKDLTETVSFEGDELTIVVDNTLGVLDYLTLCFGGSPEESQHPCPLGFARFTHAIGANKKIQFTVNRQGQFDSTWGFMCSGHVT